MNNNKKITVLVSFFLVLFLVFSGGCETVLLQVDKTDEGLLVAENGNKVLFYQKEQKSLDGKYARSNYVHPLYSLDEIGRAHV